MMQSIGLHARDPGWMPLPAHYSGYGLGNDSNDNDTDAARYALLRTCQYMRHLNNVLTRRGAE